MKGNGILSFFSFCDICSVDCQSMLGMMMAQQKQDSHVCRRNRTFPWMLRKNKETEKKDWNS